MTMDLEDRKMSLDEITCHLLVWQSKICAFHVCMDPVFKAFDPGKESDFFCHVDDFMKSYTDAVSLVVGDFNDWLSFCDVDHLVLNEFRPFKGKLKTDWEMRTIASIDDLAKIIFDERLA